MRTSWPSATLRANLYIYLEHHGTSWTTLNHLGTTLNHLGSSWIIKTSRCWVPLFPPDKLTAPSPSRPLPALLANLCPHLPICLMLVLVLVLVLVIVAVVILLSERPLPALPPPAYLPNACRPPSIPCSLSPQPGVCNPSLLCCWFWVHPSHTGVLQSKSFLFRV